MATQIADESSRILVSKMHKLQPNEHSRYEKALSEVANSDTLQSLFTQAIQQEYSFFLNSQIPPDTPPYWQDHPTFKHFTLYVSPPASPENQRQDVSQSYVIREGEFDLVYEKEKDSTALIIAKLLIDIYHRQLHAPKCTFNAVVDISVWRSPEQYKVVCGCNCQHNTTPISVNQVCKEWKLPPIYSGFSPLSDFAQHPLIDIILSHRFLMSAMHCANNSQEHLKQLQLPCIPGESIVGPKGEPSWSLYFYLSENLLNGFQEVHAEIYSKSLETSHFQKIAQAFETQWNRTSMLLLITENLDETTLVKKDKYIPIPKLLENRLRQMAQNTQTGELEGSYYDTQQKVVITYEIDRSSQSQFCDDDAISYMSASSAGDDHAPYLTSTPTKRIIVLSHKDKQLIANNTETFPFTHIFMYEHTTKQSTDYYMRPVHAKQITEQQYLEFIQGLTNGSLRLHEKNHGHMAVLETDEAFDPRKPQVDSFQFGKIEKILHEITDPQNKTSHLGESYLIVNTEQSTKKPYAYRSHDAMFIPISQMLANSLLNDPRDPFHTDFNPIEIAGSTIRKKSLLSFFK